MQIYIHLEEFKNACRDSKGRLRVAAAIGVTDDYMERAEALVKEGVDVLGVDVAHAHSDMAIEAITKLKKFNVDILKNKKNDLLKSTIPQVSCVSYFNTPRSSSSSLPTSTLHIFLTKSIHLLLVPGFN